MQVGDKVYIKLYSKMGKELKKRKGKIATVKNIYPNFVLIEFKEGYKECYKEDELRLVKEV